MKNLPKISGRLMITYNAAIFLVTAPISGFLWIFQFAVLSKTAPTMI
jgi:hypothetical protein